MSIRAIAAAFALEDVTATEKLLLICLANYANENLQCWPSSKRLVKDSCLSERTVFATLSRLAETGRIVREVRKRTDGAQSSNLYSLAFVDASAESAPPPASAAPPPASAAPPPASAAPPPASAAPLTTLEPSKNRQRKSLSDFNRERPSRNMAVEKPTREMSLADAIWASTPKPGRERSSRADLARALEAALGRGHGAQDIQAGLEAYYRTRDATKEEGKFAKGVHRMIENDRWQAFTMVSEACGEGILDPPDHRQRAWAKDYLENPGWWRDHERGPAPGQPGCRIAPDIQAEFGFSPAPPRLVAGGR